MSVRPVSCRFVTVILIVFAAGSPAPAQNPLPSRIPLGLDVSLPATKRLAGTQEFVQTGDWDAANRALDLLVEDFGESLIEVESRRFVNVRVVAAATRAQLPADGLAAYRRRVDPALQLMYDEAAARRDPRLMQQLVDEGFASSVGDDALDWLAETAFEAGDFDRARQCWTTMLPPPAEATALPPAVLRYPDADLAEPEICARLILCSLLQRDLRRARAELASFEVRFDQPVGDLAGRNGPLARTLSLLLDEARDWHGGSGTSRPDIQSASTAETLPRPHGVVWSVSIVNGHADAAATAISRPSAWKDAALLSSRAGLRALSVTSGRSKWPAGETDDGILDASVAPDVEAERAASGVPCYDGQVVAGHWYGRRGSSISVPAVRAAPVQPSELVCLNLEAQGRLEWTVTSDELAELSGARFSGAPIVVAGKLLVSLRRAGPQVETALACFDATGGSLQWVQPLCAALESQPVLRHQIHQDRLAVGAGLVFQCPGAGVIAARDLDTGRLLWAVTYDVAAESSAGGTVGPTSSSLMYDGGRLFVKPGDADRLIVLNANDGRILWSFRCPDRISDLLGVDSGRLIAGGDHLWGFDVETGEPWRFGFDDPEGFGFGQGIVAAGRAYWTTRDELFVVETDAGTLIDRIPLPGQTGITGGNLAISGETLLIASPSRLTALGPRPTP